MKTGIELIAEERARQISEEGWAAVLHDVHTEFELTSAGCGYAQAAMSEDTDLPFNWPWHHESWKPSSDPIRNLVKAGALIATEIDRLQRTRSTKPLP